MAAPPHPRPVARRNKRGVALLVVLGLVALLLIYSITAQTAVDSTRVQSKTQGRALGRTLATASLLAQAGAWKTARTEQLRVGENPDLAAEVTLKPLTAGDDFWRQWPGLKPLAGDALATVLWRQPPSIQATYLINVEGRRQGAVRLPAAMQKP